MIMNAKQKRNLFYTKFDQPNALMIGSDTAQPLFQHFVTKKKTYSEPEIDHI